MKFIEPIELDMARKAYDDEKTEYAIDLYEIAAKKGSVKAMESLVYEYKNNNINKAKFWIDAISRLANDNNDRAQLAMSNFFLSGVFVFMNGKNGYDFLLKSAYNGNPEAQYLLFDYHFSGIFALYGIDKSEEKACYWLLRAYKSRHPKALYEMACYYRRKANKINKVMWLLKKSAELGFRQAQDALDTVHLWIK